MFAGQGGAGQIDDDEEGDEDVLKSEEKIFAVGGKGELVSERIGQCDGVG